MGTIGGGGGAVLAATLARVAPLAGAVGVGNWLGVVVVAEETRETVWDALFDELPPQPAMAMTTRRATSGSLRLEANLSIAPRLEAGFRLIRRHYRQRSSPHLLLLLVQSGAPGAARIDGLPSSDVRAYHPLKARAPCGCCPDALSRPLALHHRGWRRELRWPQ